MNAVIWDIINSWGWAFWLPCVLVAAKNLLVLASLDAPTSNLGRAARVFAWLAHIPMVFCIKFNALGCIALPLMLIANNLLYVQIQIECRKARGEAPARDTSFAQWVLSSIVQKQ